MPRLNEVSGKEGKARKQLARSVHFARTSPKELAQPSKAELRQQLAQAMVNTAAMQQQAR